FAWFPAAGDWSGCRRGSALADGDHGDGRPRGFHAADAGGDPGGLRPAGSPLGCLVRRARRAQAREDRRAPGRCGAGRAARMNLAELSLKRPVTAVMFFVVLVVIGMIAAFRLQMEYFPTIDVPFLMVDIP